MFRHSAAALVLALAFPLASSAVEAQSPVPLGPLPRVVVPVHYRLDFTIDPAKGRFSGHDEIAVTFKQSESAIYIHGLDIHVSHAEARLQDGKTVPVTYAQVDKSGVAQLTFASAIPAGAATLVFDYDAPFNQSLAGLYKVTERGDAYAFTQFEAIDARRAFPSFDEPGFKTPFDVTITAPVSDKVVANTPVTGDTGAGDGMMKWTFETTRPLPTYLVAFAVGPLDIVNAGEIPPDKYRGKPLPLRGIAARGMGPRMKYALSLTPAIIRALENYYGVGYPFQKVDILAVPDFAAGAMENAGAVTFREQLLLMGDNASLDQKRSSLDVQAHELAHQWFGDYVTPSWWDNIWLNESFATWMESKISGMVRPDEEFSRETLNSGLAVMNGDELPSARQIHQPVNGPDDIDNAFDDITYSKGAAVLAMFESYVGPAQWQKGIHAYLQKFAYGNATAQDFIGTIAQATGHPEIVQAFDDFIDQPHVPLLTTDLRCAAKSALAEVSQSTYVPLGLSIPQGAWHVPMCLSADGKKVCRIAPPEPVSVALGAKCPAVLIPNADGAGYYRFSMAEPQWRKLLASAKHLNAADQLTLFFNVDAALRAGQANASDLFALMRAVAPNAQWDLLSRIRSSLHGLRLSVIGQKDLPAYEAFVRENFAPRLTAIGLKARPGEMPAAALAREALASLLVEEAHDPATTATLAKAAQDYLSSGGKDFDGLPPELLREALRAAVMSEGPAFMDRLIAAYGKSDSEFFYNIAIYAAAGSEDEAALNKFLAFSLTPQVRTGDLLYVLRYFANEPASRPLLWSWFKTNYAALLKRISAQGMSYAPALQANACDDAAKAEVQAFFGPKTAELQGTPRILRQTVERIDRCTAFRNAKGAEIEAALNGAK